MFTAEAWGPQAAYPGNAAFVAQYTKKYGSPPTEDAANSYTAGQVLAVPRQSPTIHRDSCVAFTRTQPRSNGGAPTRRSTTK